MSCLDEFDLMSILELEADLTDQSLDQFIDAVRTRYGLRNIAYICPSFHGRGFTDPVMAVTYSDAWVEHYKAERYMTVDPVIRMGARSLLPFDWCGLPRMEKKVKRPFGEAREAGVGRHGRRYRFAVLSTAFGLFWWRRPTKRTVIGWRDGQI